MKAYFVRFWGLAATLAGIAALYVGAVAIQKTIYFWIVVIASALIAAIKPGFKAIADMAIRFRGYPRLLTRVAVAEDTIEQLKNQLSDAQDYATEARRLGLAEGRDQTLGSILSIGLADLPEISGIADESGTIALVARYRKDVRPRTKTRFNVISRGTGEVKGIVEVSRLDEDRELCFLRCVQPTAEKFWEHLAGRVAYDESAPGNTMLERYVITDDENMISVYGDYSLTGAAEVAE